MVNGGRQCCSYGNGTIYFNNAGSLGFHIIYQGTMAYLLLGDRNGSKRGPFSSFLNNTNICTPFKLLNPSAIDGVASA